MAGPSFVSESKPHYGQALQIAPGVRRIVADNPSKFTYHGTGTYIVGDRQVAIIDAGPRLQAHVDAVLRAVGDAEVTHLLVTHTHGDHSPSTAAIKSATGATSYGFGSHPAAAKDEGEAEREDTAAREDTDELPSPEQTRLHAADTDFVPDVQVKHGDVIVGEGFSFEAIHTPGHISNHLCFSYREASALFSGDHVMGWSTTIIPSPDGDMGHYLSSLELLLERDETVYYPTHGPPITNPREFVGQLLEHRLARGRQILHQLADTSLLVDELVEIIYADVSKELHKPAARSVESHLILLEREGRVSKSGDNPPRFCAT
ncbi:MAG: MBL fold metallo-hydrolase [Acidimicrobiales bacterium]